MARETLVVLPGMMCDARLFGPQIEALKDHYSIFVPDLSGPKSKSGMAKRVLDETKTSTFNLLGLSMGGIVAMAIAGIAPQRVTRLALLDTNHKADAPANFAIRNRQIEQVKSGHLRAVITEEMKPRYLARANRNRQDLLGLLISMAMDLGVEAFINQSIALRDRPDHASALRRFSGPSLILCGDEDMLCPPQLHNQMANMIKDATLNLVTGAGHITTLEQPDTVVRAMNEWLCRN